MYEYGHGIQYRREHAQRRFRSPQTACKCLSAGNRSREFHHIFSIFTEQKPFLPAIPVMTYLDFWQRVLPRSRVPLSFRRIGIADIDRGIPSPSVPGKMASYEWYGSSHICQLMKFAVGDGLHSLRMIDDSRICDQETQITSNQFS